MTDRTSQRAEKARLRLLARVRLGAPAPMTAAERKMLEAVPHRHTHRGRRRGGLATAATGLGGLVSHYPVWHSAKGLLVTLGWVVLAGAVACALGLVGFRLKPIFGLIERFFTLSVIV